MSLLARALVEQPPSESVCSVVAEKLKVGCLWKKLARDLEMPDSIIEATEKKEKGDKKQCCRAALRWGDATTREIMIWLTNMGYGSVNWHIMRELDLVARENMPQSERS